WIGRDAGSSWEFPVAQAPSYRSGARRLPGSDLLQGHRRHRDPHWIGNAAGIEPARIAQALGALTARWDAALQARGLGS
ncbi:selenocysteine lyase, partial [Xanthomonas arboricola]